MRPLPTVGGALNVHQQQQQALQAAAAAYAAAQAGAGVQPGVQQQQLRPNIPGTRCHHLQTI